MYHDVESSEVDIILHLLVVQVDVADTFHASEQLHHVAYGMGNTHISLPGTCLIHHDLESPSVSISSAITVVAFNS